MSQATDFAQHAAPPGYLDSRLLDAAVSLSGLLDLPTLVERVAGYLMELPGLVAGGVGVCDDERSRFRCLWFTVSQLDPAASAAPDTAPIGSPGRENASIMRSPLAIDEVPLADSEAALLRDAAAPVQSGDLQHTRTSHHERLLFEAGARRYVGVPMRLGEHLVGGLRLGFADSPGIEAGAAAYLQRLACIVAPLVWNCLNAQRFAHGDRRRDSLMELSNVINTSLDLQTVIDSARQSLARLEGHCVTEIALLDADGATLRSYRRIPSLGHADEPELLRIADTALSWVLERGCAYQSEDLDAERRFADDADLRRLGVRRYVAAPMFVRGRVIGALVFGTDDPRPVPPVDLWLYENIALQIALAVDNASQYEEVRRLSDHLAEQNVYLREEIRGEHNFHEMVGSSPAMRQLSNAIDLVARTHTTVLITGQTGAGKELVARAIHAAGDRADQPMVKINCAAIPEGMVESELFGHERGAFTSAFERRIGRFELARGSTLFLDEIGELPPGLQAKLLTVLQDGDFQRVGGTETLTSDARIIAATNRDLAEAVAKGAFRSDLFYRLNVFPIHVPSLKERREDIPLLVEAFVAQFNRTLGKNIETLDRASMDYLCARDWPGNVRELKHVIERAMILAKSRTLVIDETPHATPPRRLPPVDHGGLTATLNEVEAEQIRRALVSTGGVIEGTNGAAALVGLKPSTFRFRMSRLGIPRR